MLLHVLYHAVDILEEPGVAQLVYFVVADGLDLHLLADLSQVGVGSADGGDTGAGEADLGSRRELVDHIRVPFLLALHQDLQEIVLFILVEMVDAVSVVPEDPEIFCRRFQLGKAVYSLVRVGDSLGVGVLGYAPDSLNSGIIVDQFFYHIHIRAFHSHGNRDHLDAEIFGDREVTVISRNRT